MQVSHHCTTAQLTQPCCFALSLLTHFLSPPPPLPAVLSCSICTKKGYLHLYVPPSQFQLLTDPAALSTYTFNTGVAQHHFCSRCGVSPYYRPRSHPNDFDVNVRCLDDFHHVIDRVQITPFNGQRWEESIAGIKPPYLHEPQQQPAQRNSHSTS